MAACLLEADKLLNDIQKQFRMQARPCICALRPALVVSICAVVEWHPDLRSPRNTLNIYTDSSGSKGLGGIFGDQWYSSRCPTNSGHMTSNLRRYMQCCMLSSDGATSGRAPHCLPSRQLSHGLGHIIRDNPELSSYECVEVDFHAASAAGFQLFFFLARFYSKFAS